MVFGVLSPSQIEGIPVVFKATIDQSHLAAYFGQVLGVSGNYVKIAIQKSSTRAVCTPERF